MRIAWLIIKTVALLASSKASPTTPVNVLCAAKSNASVPDSIVSHGEWWSAADEEGKEPLPNCCEWGKNMTHMDWHGEANCIMKGRLPRYSGPGSGGNRSALLAALSGRNVVIMGDSISRQWFSSLACYTGAKWAGWHGSRDAAREISTKLHLSASSNIENTFSQMAIPGSDGGVISIYVTKQMSADDRLAIIEYHAHRERADLIVINDGLHCQAQGVACKRKAKINEDLRELLHMQFKACKLHGAYCAFRETTPQHFVSRGDSGFPSGLYGQRIRGIKGCIKPSSLAEVGCRFDARANWRNAVLHEVASQYPGMPIIPVFGALLPLVFAHAGGECTHFSENMEFWEPQHQGLLRTLRNIPQKWPGTKQ